MTAKRITREEAEAAIQASAKDDHIGFITALPGGAVRRDGFDVATARLILVHADLFAYQEGPFGYNLAVLSGSTVYHFDVPMPEDQAPVEADDLLTEHGWIMRRALSAWADKLDQHHTEVTWAQEALQALHAYLEDDK